MPYVSRIQAAQHAHKRGLRAFSCHQDASGNWDFKVEVENNALRDALNWAKNKDFVSHIEMHSSDAILIVTCFREDFAGMNVPFKVAPATPSLWKQHEEAQDKVLRSRDTGVYDRSSTALNPTALVHQICDANPGATKAQIVAICVEKGIHPSTASTQFYRWRSKQSA